ncbi:MAG: hypothetical protein AB1762_05660 [Gemmatimonadota bacterium]
MLALVRVGYLALMLVFGQYLLVGSGFGCSAASSGDAASMSDVTMAVQAAPDHDAGCGEPQEHASCTLDGVTCSAMAGCATVVMSLAARQTVTTPSLTHELVLVDSRSVTARNIPPDPPPPRA